MQRKSALLALVVAVEDSCHRLDLQRSAAPAVLVPLLQRRRRMYALLRATLRWHGLPTPAPQPVVRSKPSSLPDLARSEERLIRLFDAAVEQAGEDAPESRLLAEQRADTRHAHRAVSALLRPDAAPPARRPHSQRSLH